MLQNHSLIYLDGICGESQTNATLQTLPTDEDSACVETFSCADNNSACFNQEKEFSSNVLLGSLRNSSTDFSSMNDKYPISENSISIVSNKTHVLKEQPAKVVEQSKSNASKEPLVETSISKDAISKESLIGISDHSLIEVSNESTTKVSEKSRSKFSLETKFEILNEPLTVPEVSNLKVFKNGIFEDPLVENSKQPGSKVLRESKKKVPEEPLAMPDLPKHNRSPSHYRRREESESKVSHQTKAKDQEKPLVKISEQSRSKVLKRPLKDTSAGSKSNVSEITISRESPTKASQQSPRSVLSLFHSKSHEGSNKSKNQRVSTQLRRRVSKRPWTETSGPSNDTISRESSCRVRYSSREYLVTFSSKESKTKYEEEPLINVSGQSRSKLSERPLTETSDESRLKVPEKLLAETSEESRLKIPEKLLAETSEESRLKVPEKLLAETSEESRLKIPEKLLAETSEESRLKVPEKLLAETSEESRLKVPEKLLAETSEESSSEVSIQVRSTISKESAMPETSEQPFLCRKCEEMHLAFSAFIGDRRPSFIDSHCHLDFLINREDYGMTYGHFMLKRKDTYPETYEGCVAVFCNPFTFKKTIVWQRYLEESGVWGAFGCHPHNANFYDDSVEDALCAALKHPKVCALGEIGLDYSRRNGCPRRVQHCVLRRQLNIAVTQGFPLVIHCRDANEDCMRILKEIVPRDYLLHLHCFTGDWPLARSWLDAFSNLFVGLTNWVAHAEDTRRAVHNIPLHRLLLETDAPYFLPTKMSGRWSHPGMAIYVAMEIAALKQLPLEEVLHWTRFNTHRMYGI